VKRKRELQQYSTQASNGMEHIEAHADQLFVRGCCALFVGEFLPKLGGEKKSRVCRDALNPLRSQFWTEWIVERRVDLDGVEEFSEIGGLMKSARPPMGINDAIPIGVRPSGGTDKDSASRGAGRIGIRRHEQ
jgi:hypothetical protein